GLKPNHYQQHLRVDKARQLLEATLQQIDTIAWSVGYSDPGSFRRVFARITGLSPGDYRKRFAHERVSAAPQGHRVQRA
ncbi:MAG: helix-turn-helix domain-containing protein, partial [Pseudoxanthomonas sp.]